MTNQEICENFSISSKELVHDGLKIADVNYYNSVETADKFDFVFVSQHDGDIDEFIKQYPFVVERFRNDEAVLRAYTAIDRDSGATALMNYVASELSCRGYSVATLSVENVPRSIIDSNVPSDRAIKVGALLINEDNSRKESFLSIHEALNHEMDILADKAEFFCDFHAMEPKAVREEIARRPSEMDGYRAWVRNQIQATLNRPSSLLTRYQIEDTDNFHHFGDQNIAQDLLDEAEVFGFEEGNPGEFEGHSALKNLSTARLSNKATVRGKIATAFDLNKEILGDYAERTESSIRFQISQEKLSKVGAKLVEIFVRRKKLLEERSYTN